MSILEKCVQCGSCLPACPLFRLTKLESLSPRGKLYYMMVKKNMSISSEIENQFNNALFACTHCGACSEVCDSDVDILELFLENKGENALLNPTPEFKQLTERILSTGNIFGLDNEDRIELLLDEVEEEIEDIRERIWEDGKAAKVTFFLGCMPSLKSSLIDASLSSFKVLEKLNIDYVLLGGEEFCCGHPLDVIGLKDQVKEIREHNTEILNTTGADTIITNCPGCLAALTHHYDLDVRIMHLTEFIEQYLPDKIPNPLTNKTIAYHEPCDLTRICEVVEPPIRILQKIGVKLIELEPSCCGGGGMMRLAHENLSQGVIRKRITDNNIRNIVTCCPSCEEQFKAEGIETFDLMELVDEALG
ncbi:MAG: (Fe-S)-binding protein [Promethearchaeota archaeon]